MGYSRGFSGSSSRLSGGSRNSSSGRPGKGYNYSEETLKAVQKAYTTPGVQVASLKQVNDFLTMRHEEDPHACKVLYKFFTTYMGGGDYAGKEKDRKYLKEVCRYKL